MSEAEHHPELFITHSSKDKDLAQQLFTLISDELFAGDGAATRKHIFFTSEPTAGPRAGADFRTILDRLETAKRVIALVTPNSMRSAPVLAEMSLALSAQKLTPVPARYFHRSLLKWPFERVHTACLDAPNEIRRLLADAKALCGDTVADGAADRKQAIENLASHVKRRYLDPKMVKVLWAAAIAFVVAGLGALAFDMGKDFGKPQMLYVGKDAVPLGQATIAIPFTGSLPRKLLSNRLLEISMTLGLDRSPPSETTDLFVEALRRTSPRIAAGERLRELEAIADKWNGSWSQMHFAGKTPCDDLKENLDKEWCNKVEELSGKNETDLKEFDNILFAVAAIKPKGAGARTEFVVLAQNRSIADDLPWYVRDFGQTALQRSADP